MRTRRALIPLVALSLAVTVMSGCTSSNEQLQTVNDSESLFHVKVPASWQTTSTASGLALYATDRLPATEKIDSLSVFVLVAKESDQASTTLLARIVNDRAKSRGWKNRHISRVARTKIGNRQALGIDVSGTDQSGLAFKGAYYLVRTSGDDVLVITVAPADAWDSKAVDDLRNRWYWHLPATPTKVL